MEFLTGIMIACLVYFAAILVSNDELSVSKFFSFLAAMMLAYQPVRSLATLNMTIQQGLAGAKTVLPIIDERPEIRDKENVKNLTKWYLEIAKRDAVIKGYNLMKIYKIQNKFFNNNFDSPDPICPAAPVIKIFIGKTPQSLCVFMCVFNWSYEMVEQLCK